MAELITSGMLVQLIIICKWGQPQALTTAAILFFFKCTCWVVGRQVPGRTGKTLEEKNQVIRKLVKGLNVACVLPQKVKLNWKLNTKFGQYFISLQGSIVLLRLIYNICSLRGHFLTGFVEGIHVQVGIELLTLTGLIACLNLFAMALHKRICYELWFSHLRLFYCLFFCQLWQGQSNMMSQAPESHQCVLQGQQCF